MKNLLLLCVLLLSTGLFAQSGYEKAMAAGLQQIKDAKTSNEMSSASAYFERIANSEKTNWLPYYYAALTNNLAGWMDETADKDKVSAKTNELIAQADALSKDNSEIYCLKQMSAVMAMSVDPMARWQTYGMEASSALDKAKKLDPTNPRPYMLEAQTTFYTPEQFGGGKAVAKPILEKSVRMFEAFKPASDLSPTWGLDQAQEGLANCQ